MKNDDFKRYADKAKEKLQNARNIAQDKLQDMELDKKLDNLKEQTQKTMSATAEKVKEMELDKKLADLNDNVEKHAKTAVEKTKEAVSSAANSVKEMEIDKKIENSEFEKRTGLFSLFKRYRAIIIIAVIVLGISSIVISMNLNKSNDFEAGERQIESAKSAENNSEKTNQDSILTYEDLNGESLKGQNAKAYEIFISSNEPVLNKYTMFEVMLVPFVINDNFSITISQGVGMSDDNIRFIKLTGDYTFPDVAETRYGSITFRVDIANESWKIWDNSENANAIWTVMNYGITQKYTTGSWKIE